MITPNRERRDWTLLVFIIPIGVILMLIAGQIAIRLVPDWSVNAGMQSNLDPNNLPMQQNGPIQPVLPAILTPLGWLDTFLTPGAGSGDQNFVFPPFVVFEPSATPAVTNVPPTVATTPPPPTIPTVTDSPTVVVPPIATTKPPDDEETSVPPTATQPTATQPTPVPVTSTPVGTQDSAPVDIVGTPDLLFYNLHDGQYIVIDLGMTPIVVHGPSDTDYDLVYYEWANPMNIAMDQVTIGISQNSNGSVYYTVFNWGDGVADTNSNVATVAGAENDNQAIDYHILYGTPPPLPIPPNFQTGIAIDVDSAPSNPPIGSYQYLVVLAPETASNDGADINSIEVLPDPPVAPVSVMSVQSVNEASVEVPSQPDSNAVPPADSAPSSPADEAPAPSAEEPPSSP